MEVVSSGDGTLELRIEAEPVQGALTADNLASSQVIALRLITWLPAR